MSLTFDVLGKCRPLKTLTTIMGGRRYWASGRDLWSARELIGKRFVPLSVYNRNRVWIMHHMSCWAWCISCLCMRTCIAIWTMFGSYLFVSLSWPSVVTPTFPMCGMYKDRWQNNFKLNLLGQAILYNNNKKVCPPESVSLADNVTSITKSMKDCRERKQYSKCVWLVQGSTFRE